MNGSITVSSNTTKLKPLQSHSFKIIFNNMEPCEILYELNDFDSGTIDKTGIYTAPNREGSFEIRIMCSSNTEISTYAYVDVRN